ncbi:hypothetical protein VTO42DRAFT_1778 [Malbranchea cinnamomea]
MTIYLNTERQCTEVAKRSRVCSPLRERVSPSLTSQRPMLGSVHSFPRVSSPISLRLLKKYQDTLKPETVHCGHEGGRASKPK